VFLELLSGEGPAWHRCSIRVQEDRDQEASITEREEGFYRYSVGSKTLLSLQSILSFLVVVGRLADVAAGVILPQLSRDVVLGKIGEEIELICRGLSLESILGRGRKERNRTFKLLL
jgi:hypothetical protein